MAITLWPTMYREVLPYLPKCPAIVLDKLLRDAAIEFLDRTGVYQYDHPSVDVVADIYSYNFVPPAQTVVAELQKSQYNGRDIDIKDLDYRDEQYPDWRTRTGRPEIITQLDERSVILTPTPSQSLSDGLTMRVSLKPIDSATGLETRIWQEYRKHIANGTIGMGLLMPSEPWYEPQQGNLRIGMFEDGIIKIQNRVQFGFGRARKRVKARFI